jgi:lactate racemase
MATLKLMQYAWSDDPREVDYFIPETWDVTVYEIAGSHRPVLSLEEMKAKINAPIASATIGDLARGKKKVCILFDDMSRGTPTWKIAPLVLEELKAAGIPDGSVEFICATGAHENWERRALVKKVGPEIMERYPVFNHVSFLGCTSLGKTSYGTRVEINNEVMSCDLKIAIGDVAPHPSYGFSGGGKMIMPGVSSYESIAEHHGVTHRRSGPPGQPDANFRSHQNPLLKDAIEFARMAGLNFSVQCLLNHKAEVVDIFAGDVEASHNAAIQQARQHFAIPETTDNDIAIANAFCKSVEANFAMGAANRSVKKTGGSSVVIANSIIGQIGHYLFGAWGREHGGRLWHRMPLPPHINHLMYYSEFPEGRNRSRFAEADLSRVYFPSQWAEVIGRLMEWHGTKAKVAVFPDGTNQL